MSGAGKAKSTCLHVFCGRTEEHIGPRAEGLRKYTGLTKTLPSHFPFISKTSSTTSLCAALVKRSQRNKCICSQFLGYKYYRGIRPGATAAVGWWKKRAQNFTATEDKHVERCSRLSDWWNVRACTNTTSSAPRPTHREKLVFLEYAWLSEREV